VRPVMAARRRDQFQSNGTLILNSSKFTSALSANPNVVAQLFSNATGTAAARLRGPAGGVGRVDDRGPTAWWQERRPACIDDQHDGQPDYPDATRLSQTQQQLIAQYSKLNAAMVTAQQNRSRWPMRWQTAPRLSAIRRSPCAPRSKHGRVAGAEGGGGERQPGGTRVWIWCEGPIRMRGADRGWHQRTLIE